MAGVTLTVTYLKWRDSTYIRTPTTQDVASSRPIELHTVGWLVKEDRTAVSLAMEIDPSDNTYRDYLIVPKVNILFRSDRRVALK